MKLFPDWASALAWCRLVNAIIDGEVQNSLAPQSERRGCPLRYQVAELRRIIDKLHLADKRQTAPFSKGSPKPKRVGAQARRRLPRTFLRSGTAADRELLIPIWISVKGSVGQFLVSSE